MAEYQVLSQDEQDDIVVSFMLSQEKDKFCLELNSARFDEMLKGLEEGDWRTRVVQLHADATKRLAEVDSIIKATLPTLPPSGRVEATILRLKAKETRIG